MQSLVSRITVTLDLLVCLVGPLVEMFDHWDDTIQTGNDTEYGLVALALCVGVAYSFARFIFRCSLRFLARNTLTSCVHKAFLSTPCSFVPLLFNPLSPATRHCVSKTLISDPKTRLGDESVFQLQRHGPSAKFVDVHLSALSTFMGMG